jgi:hypothetical protein
MHDSVNIMFAKYFIQNRVIAKIALYKLPVFNGIFVTTTEVIQGNDVRSR